VASSQNAKIGKTYILFRLNKLHPQIAGFCSKRHVVYLEGNRYMKKSYIFLTQCFFTVLIF